MPEKTTMERVERDRREGKSPGTQAGEFVREEIRHVREGKHGVRSTKQAIAIGLSEARRAGVRLPPPRRSGTNQRVRRQAQRDLAKGANGKRTVSRKRSHATSDALRGESAAGNALARQARLAARQRSPADRSAAARKAARTRKARI